MFIFLCINGQACTVSMDKLGALAYNSGKTLYTYKNEVPIPLLGMIDDVLAFINSFIDSKKLQLSSKSAIKFTLEKRKLFVQL